MGTEILRFAQDDTGWQIRLSSTDEPMMQYVGISGFAPPLPASPWNPREFLREKCVE
jgi:hypothetical protein